LCKRILYADIQVPAHFLQHEKIDVDYRRELEQIITDALTTKISLEEKTILKTIIAMTLYWRWQLQSMSAPKHFNRNRSTTTSNS